jgi:protein-disulfide isomerase
MGVDEKAQIKVLVFGPTPSCARCRQAEQEAREAAAKFPPDRVVVEKHDAVSELARRFQVYMTPTVVVNGRVAAVGRLLPMTELVEVIARELVR